VTSIDDVIRLLEAAKGQKPIADMVKSTKSKKKRKPSAYQKRYGAAFKRLAPKYRKKGGGWKKDGFKRCAAAARKVAKR